MRVDFDGRSLPQFIIALIGLTLLSGPCSDSRAQTTLPANGMSYRFDFGSDQMVEPGYLPVTSGLLFSPEKGHGWLDASGLLIRDQGKPDALHRDFVMGSQPATFRVANIPPGTYLLTIVSGDFSSGNHATRVRINGSEVAFPELRQRSGEASTLQATIDVRGPVELTFDSPERSWIVNAVSLTPADAPQPVSVRRSRPTMDSDDAKSHTLVFSTESPGRKLRLTHWGLDTALPDPNNVRRGVLYMGQDQVDVIRVSFPINTPLVNGELPESKKAHFTFRLAMAKLAGDKPFTMLPDTEAGVHPWYKHERDVIPERWIQLLEASQRMYGKKLESIEAYNEADYGWGQGSAKNLNDILRELRKRDAFAGVELSGPSTLSSDAAEPWYQTIKEHLDHGSTHALGGSFHSYVNFFLNVSANGDLASQPELHNLVEGIAGAEYGLQSAIWWLTAERARSEFVKAVQGERLAYAEDRAKWSAAAVYRRENGKVQAFLGSSERMGQTTVFRFVSRDREVFFNGEGPRRDFTMPIRRDTDNMINIDWGEDVPPPVGGRYILVNRQTGKALTVSDASHDPDAALQLSDYSQAGHQQWEVLPIFTRWQDQAYVTLRAMHSAKVLGIPEESYESGAPVRQTGDGESVSQHWFLEYAGDNCFHVVNRWSAQKLTAADGKIQQMSGDAGLSQKWRFVPVGVDKIDLDPPHRPAGLVAKGLPLAVQVKWEANAEPDLAGYTILRASTSGGTYDTIARGVTGTAYVDNTANDTKTYYYIVKAVDRSLNVSERSSEAAAASTGGEAMAAHYRFDGNPADSSGHGNHAGVFGSPLFSAGRRGSASFVMNGPDDHLRLPAGVVDSDELSIAAWVYHEGGIQWQRVFDFGNDESQYFFLTTTSSDNTLRLAAKNGGEEIRLDAKAPADNKWFHLSITLKDQTAKMHVNGKVVANSDRWTIKPGDFKPIFNYIGRSQFPADPYFNGRVSDLRIFNHAISDDEVQRLADGMP